MKLTLRIIETILFGVMVVSLILLATKLDFTSSNDKEPVYWFFFVIVFAYVLVSFFFIWKSYKTNKIKYRIISIVLGLLYVLFLIYLYS